VITAMMSKGTAQMVKYLAKTGRLEFDSKSRHYVQNDSEATSPLSNRVLVSLSSGAKRPEREAIFSVHWGGGLESVEF
jgi:hypothetical protein